MGTSQKTVWVNRTEIKSATSDRVYVVSQHRARRFWGCSCPGWRAHRRCKHLTALGLPGNEVPFEVDKGHPARPDFLAGYASYDPAAGGYGSPAGWQRSFADRMGLPEARQELGLPPTAGWDEVRAAVRLAGTESLDRLVAEYAAAARAFGGPGSVEEQAAAVRAARFRVEAYLAYLDDQRQKLEAAAARVTEELLARVKTL
jgi:hypothetical protein